MEQQRTSHFNISDIDKAHIRLIVKIVCEHLDIPVESLFVVSRKKHLVNARQVLFYFCTQYLDVPKSSLCNIPSLWGSDRVYNHATILHAIKQIENYIFTDKRYREQINKIRCDIEIGVMKSDEISNSLKIRKATQTINMLLKEQQDPFYAEYLLSKLKNLIDERRNQDIHEDSGLDMVQKPIYI